MTIIWVPNSQDGAWLVPDDAEGQVQQRAAELQRQPEPDQLLQRMARREADAEQVADQIRKSGRREPGAIFGGGAAHLRHHDVRSAAGKGEDDLRSQHLAQHIAEKGAVADQLADIAAEAAAHAAVARVSGSAMAISTATLSDAAVMK
jgi:hypothetical protein